MYNYKLRFPCQEPCFEIITDDEALLKELNLIYKPFEADCFEHNLNICNIRYMKDDKVLFADNKMLYLDMGAFNKIENIIYEKVRTVKSHIAIHAAAVSYNDKAYLLCGATKAGKSTLTAFLCLNGFEYITDDIALVDKQSLLLTPYPRPLQLREGGLEVLINKYGFDRKYGLDKAYEFGEGESKRKILNFSKPSKCDYEINSIFFLNRNADENKVANLEQIDSFIKVMTSLYAYMDKDVSTIRTISKLSNMAYEIKYTDMEYIRNYIMELG